MTQKLVSIITPAYNAEKYIAETIQSVLGQTYENWEMLIADDGSTDTTAEIVKSFRDPRIRYFHQENGGLSAARNLSLQHAKGEYIALLDSDDIFLPNKLERQVAYLESHPQCDFCYCEVRNFSTDQPGKFWLIAMPRLSGNLKDELIRRGGHFMGPLSVVFRRKLYDKFGGFNPRFRRDEYYLYLKFAIGGARFCFLNEILASYRFFNTTSLSREAAHLKDAAKDNLEIFNWLDRFLPTDDPSRKWLEHGRSYWQLRIALGCFILGDKRLGLEELKKAKRGRLLVPIFFILPASLSSWLLRVLRRRREASLFKEIRY